MASTHRLAITNTAARHDWNSSEAADGTVILFKGEQEFRVAFDGDNRMTAAAFYDHEAGDRAAHEVPSALRLIVALGSKA